MLRTSVERYPDLEAIAQVGGDNLDVRAALGSGGARRRGAQARRPPTRGPGRDVFAPSDWVLAFWGAQLAGLVTVPVNTRFTEPEVEYVVKDSGAAYAFTPGAALPAPRAVTDDFAPADLAAIFYTSGTTGFPKER